MAGKDFTIVLKAKDLTKKGFSSMRSGLNSAGRAITSTQAKIAGLVGAGGMVALVKMTADYNDALAKNADVIGINSQRLGELRHVADQLAGGYQGIGEALIKAQKRVGEFNATGGGAAAQWIKKLNLDVSELVNLSPDELFRKYSEEVNKLNTRGEKLAAISALMGDESRKFINIIEAGPEAMDELSDRASKMGLAISRVDAAKIEAMNDAMDESRKVFQGVANTITIELSPYIQVLSKRFADLAVESNGFRDAVISGIDIMAEGIAFVADMWRGYEVIWAGLKAAFDQFALTIVQGLAFVEEGYNSQIKTINELTGSTIAYSDTAMHMLAGVAQSAMKTKQEFNELANEPMPSTHVKSFMDEVKAVSQEAAEAVAETKNELFEVATSPVIKSGFLVDDEWKEILHEDQAEWDAIMQEWNEKQAQQIYERINAERDAAKAISSNYIAAAQSASSIVADLGGKQAAAAKAALLLEKGAAAASIWINGEQAIWQTRATVPFPLAEGIVKSIEVSRAISLAAVAASTIKGMKAASGGGGGGGGGRPIAGAERPAGFQTGEPQQQERPPIIVNFNSAVIADEKSIDDVLVPAIQGAASRGAMIVPPESDNGNMLKNTF